MSLRNARAFTAFTKGLDITEEVYATTPDEWVQVILLLETAGPVAYGYLDDMSPTLSGKGVLLATGLQKKITMPPSTRLLVVSQTVNRVGVDISPFPWLEGIMATLQGATPGASVTPVPPTVPKAPGNRTAPKSPAGSTKIPQF